MKNITDRKRAEEAFRQSEQKFRLVSETIENVFWMSTCGVGEMLYISPAYENLWEKSWESLYRFPKSFMEAIHPDDREMYSTVLAQYGYLDYIGQDGDLIRPSMTTTIMDQCRIPGKSIVFSKDRWGGLWGRSLQQRIAVRRNHTLDVPRGHISLSNTLIAPIIIDNELVGQIALANKPSGFNRQDEEKLVSIADFLAPILKIYLEKENVKKQLPLKAEKLKERNIALKVLLENRDQEKRQQAEKLTQNFDRLVSPYYEKLKACNGREDRRALLEIIESNTHDCLSTAPPPHHRYYREFTPMEVQVADLIKSGKSSKEIAMLLNISPRSVYFHRNNLRRKLNIHKTNTNLRTFLATHH